MGHKAYSTTFKGATFEYFFFICNNLYLFVQKLSGEVWLYGPP